MAGTIIAAGLGLAAIGFAGRYILRAAPGMSQKMSEAMKALPKLDTGSFANSKYYKGGFEPKMTRREASLILGISPTASKIKIKVSLIIKIRNKNEGLIIYKYYEAHKRIMGLNHPDRGGSPLIAAKINEAKDLLESGKSS
ncbi:hypothetical protein L9F63_022465 [Diploptera punctata]|uniref:Mitochondrial import inner membrane translocase subunit TIM14 n=1 Tax=Diploptera punctata TaxID=6984 RepID=A0AAD7ZM13_DIPPU|nr:hypothetical protein L9F63_022465 [Diploptera punctata]